MKGKRLAAYIVVGALVGGGAIAAYLLVGKTKLLSQVSKTYSTMSLLGEALGAYQTSSGVPVPYLDTAQGPVMNRAAINKKFLYRLDIKADPSTVSDPFSPVKDSPFHYWTDGKIWTLWSAGPDGAYEIMKPEVYTAPQETLVEHIAPYQYDPTNGTYSVGDLVYTYRPSPENAAP